MPKISNPLYAEKVKKLSKIESERLLSRMSGKLPRRLEKDKLSRDEALALQMELEDEQLQEWRKMMATLNKKAESKDKPKEKAAEKAKPVAKAKAAAKDKSTEKAPKTVKSKKTIEKTKKEQAK